MGQEFQTRPTTTRTLWMPVDEAVPRASRSYRVHSIRMEGEFDIGVSVPPDEDGTIDDVPPRVHDHLTDMAEENIDLKRVEAETTAEDWPVIGTVTLSRVDDETVNLVVEWEPPS